MKTEKILVFAAALFLLNLAACDSNEINKVTPSADAARANREDSSGVANPDSIPTFPVDSIPADSIPTDSIPTNSIPTDSIPLDSVRNDSIATDSLKK
ncbi:hypothetical protein [Dyadobacter sp. Leaf189]|uniref:hypothetical protein n=1 Tax=Dyadobacter sp. Leaf189 TaxID=1736295 RepID=UPI0006F5F5F5|nr:hypothetical protein [Dyadobacter sp. Leaf189]KQS24667.1 hypothetical protein ASG33_23160 [Dyadobacter sp. Leaf189]